MKRQKNEEGKFAGGSRSTLGEVCLF